jgi:hypothetical protein
MIKKSTKLIHEGKYVAEVEIELHYNEKSWSPTMTGVRTQLETVRSR